MRVRCLAPEFKLLSEGLALARGDVGTLPDDAKWKARAAFWFQQGILEDASEPEKVPEPPKEEPPVAHKRKRSKRSKLKAVEKDAESS